MALIVGQLLAECESYGRGDLDAAQTLFEALHQRKPEDPRTVYKLAMLNLQRAYDGLQRYLALETDSTRKQRTVELLRRLSELN